MRIMFLVFLCGLISISTVAIAEEKQIKIGLITWPGHGAVFVGQQKGFFQGLDIKPIVLDDTNARNAAWQSGKLDMVVNTVDVTPIEYSQGLQGKLFAVTDASVGGDGIIVGKQIRTIPNLKGKTISVARGNPSHFLLYSILRDHDLTLKDVKLKFFDDAGAAATAYIAGEVDAAVTYEPYLSQALKAKTESKVLVTSKEYPEDIIDVMRVSEKFLQDNPISMRKFINGLYQSIAYIQKYPQESAAIMGKGFGVPAKDMVDMMKGVAYFDQKLSKTYFCGKTPKIVTLYDRAAKLWQDEAVIVNNPPSGKEVISDIICTVGISE